MINQYLFRHFLPAALAILSAAIFISASELRGPRGAGGLHYGLSLSQESGSKRNARPGEPAQNQAAGNIPKPKAVNARYFYEFSQPQFYVRKVRIEHDSNGRGKITFERLNEDL
ncbi:MAG TPA: hypothetical protein VFV61_03885, partial [Pyrinomonadaceae bacterium]|nr:hypothetical protein [Pyrinomonadaceae bacterium]